MLLHAARARSVSNGHHTCVFAHLIGFALDSLAKCRTRGRKRNAEHSTLPAFFLWLVFCCVVSTIESCAVPEQTDDLIDLMMRTDWEGSDNAGAATQRHI